jgi:hypothetical protein
MRKLDTLTTFEYSLHTTTARQLIFIEGEKTEEPGEKPSKQRTEPNRN